MNKEKKENSMQTSFKFQNLNCKKMFLLTGKSKTYKDQLCCFLEGNRTFLEMKVTVISVMFALSCILTFKTVDYYSKIYKAPFREQYHIIRTK